MNCSQIQNLLSDYYDHEVSSDINQEIETHLKTCESCTESLTAFESLSQLAGDLSTPVAPANMWEEIEGRLQEEAGQIVSPVVPVSQFGLLKKYSLLIVAATVLLAVGIGYLNQPKHEQLAHQHHSDAVFNQYLTAFENNPDSAQQILLKNYQNDLVEPGEAVRLLGYQPAITKSLPAEYEIEASYVIKMPCCTCLQTICKRKDGSQIIIFEHDDETPQWFEGQPKKNMTCNGKVCCLVNLDSQMAASWQHGKRHITVIGINNEQEVDKLIAWSDQAGSKS